MNRDTGCCYLYSETLKTNEKGRLLIIIIFMCTVRIQVSQRTTYIQSVKLA